MTSTPVFADLAEEPAEPRAARLARQIRALRTRARTGGDDRLLLVVGATLMPLGLLAIFLGWLGASQTPLLFEQNSYLISGGVFGLGLLLCGGFVYLTYWQSVHIRAARAERRELTAVLVRIEAALLNGTGVGAPGLPVQGGPPRIATAPFVATPNGSIFHRPDCQVVAGREDLTAVDPDRTRLQPCRICQPLQDRV